MKFPKTTKKGQGALAAGSIISALIPLIIILMLWGWARGAVSDALESVLPGNFGRTVTNLLFGFLALYFLLKFLGRWGGS